MATRPIIKEMLGKDNGILMQSAGKALEFAENYFGETLNQEYIQDIIDDLLRVKNQFPRNYKEAVGEE